MRRLTRDQIDRKAALVARLRASGNALETACAAYNARVQEEHEILQAVVDKHNETLEEAVDLAREITSDLENYHADKSEKWQESSKGEEFCEWIRSWGSVEHGGNVGVFTQFEVDEPEDACAPTDSAADELESLPEEPGVIS